MTAPTDDTLTAIGRQLSITYLPTVLEPLPRELNDLVSQLVAMDKMEETKQADPWTWIVIGLVFSAVTAALYGPFVWEHWVI